MTDKFYMTSRTANIRTHNIIMLVNRLGGIIICEDQLPNGKVRLRVAFPREKKECLTKTITSMTV